MALVYTKPKSVAGTGSYAGATTIAVLNMSTSDQTVVSEYETGCMDNGSIPRRAPPSLCGAAPSLPLSLPYPLNSTRQMPYRRPLPHVRGHGYSAGQLHRGFGGVHAYLSGRDDGRAGLLYQRRGLGSRAGGNTVVRFKGCN